MALSNENELHSIFSLFESNTGEISIKRVNEIIGSISALNQKKVFTSNSMLNDDEELNKSIEQGMSKDEIEDKKKESLYELKAFPNKKQALNFNDFAELYNDCFSSKENEEELLKQCFASFDSNE